MKKLIFLIIIPVIFMQSYAAEVYDMPDLADPHLFTVDKDDIYISERSKIYIYKYPDKLVRVFGKKGEGPGEFREYFDQGLLITPFRGDLCIESNGRVSYFKKDGTFINEIKTGSGHMYTPVGNNFVAIRWGVIDNFAYNRIILKSSGMKMIKMLQMKKNWYQEGRDVNPVDVRNPRYTVMNRHIYAEAPDGSIHIYDASGKEAGIAKKDYTRVKVTEKDKEMYHEYYRTHKYYKERYHQLRHLIKFPKHYPPVKFFDSSGGSLYVMTHVRKNGKNEVYIYDEGGKFKRKVFIKMRDINKQELYPRIRFANNRIYQLLEDMDEEAWQLHITDIPSK